MENAVILLVEDNADDEALTLRALKKNNIKNGVVVERRYRGSGSIYPLLRNVLQYFRDVRLFDCRMFLLSRGHVEEFRPRAEEMLA
jgi:hypothetical protein